MKRPNTVRAQTLRRTMTDAEKAFWKGVRAGQIAGHKFRRQWPIGGYIADFVCLEQKLIVEIDGSQHADSASDKQRTENLEAMGFRILRFWNTEALTNTDGVLEIVAEALNVRA